jgi:ParB/Sulfiredoxin domain
MRFDRADGEGDGHSIKEWGWTTPALVGEDGGLIAGHARVLAARQLGIAEIPVMVAAGWSEAQKRAYVLADTCSYRGDLRIRVGPSVFRVWDQPIDRPALDLVGRPRPLISGRLARRRAPARQRGSVGAFTRRPTRSRPRSASRH